VSTPRTTVSDPALDVMARLDDLEEALRRLPEGPGRTEVAGRLDVLRATMERQHAAEREARHQLGHDLRVPLNAIAGWSHILRLDATPGGSVLRAVEVFERNVRALTQVIEAYTASERERVDKSRI
jgi:hypothetical protein